ncbi:pentatricopeptide repeat-containing protein At4g20770-like [Chenopodium quinoa]|uniref:pentatricopeptide repeat-containing protein At4g20770-like n=1 Tax=Chenopodium quinoa TaxID=63459 RepID=UPI000B76EB3D|nr:pentatricopeptide repeat-containing protein At4g20770-like [Chenopodium quinoa]XP_021760915.1 pentatricopeptide repeat-containing protein At4g20770-like [Chenopodium quinoa]XP_021760916.1 pentatricopeptide repeat-containing protein At4g20770-like [Chenopodium quinoa]XP_021760917.1 pentatricopeptide repeat-containing protein At4g20770-like [Chenopodium quinoa]
MWRQRREFIANLLESFIKNKSHKSGKLLHAHIIRTGFISQNFFSNRLIDFYSKCDNPRYGLNVFDVMPERDIFSWNSVLSTLCAVNRMQDACQVFDEMPERNVVSWNNMISAFVRNGDHGKALEMYKLMVLEGLVPTHFTLASVFSACGVLVQLNFGRLCHNLAIKVGADQNLYVGNALLSMYAKCRCIGDAIRAFEELPAPNEVSFTALMGGLKETRRVEEALGVFKLMHKTKACIDAVSLSSILGVCTRREGDGQQRKMHGKLVHSLSIKLGLQDDFHLVNSLLDMYAKNGDMDNAEIIFQNMSNPNVVSWNIMIAGYGEIYKCEKAVELMERMVFSGCQPDEVTCINMIAASVKSGNVEVGRQVFDKLVRPSLSSWNAMLSGYSQVEKHDEAIMLFREMQFRNVKPDCTTLATVLASCAEMAFLECGKQVHAVTLKATLNDDVYVGSGLITLYSRSGKVDIAKSIFHGLPAVDIVCWNSIIAGFSLNSLEKEAFSFFNIMKRRNMCPTQFTYATILSCCAKQSFSSQGRQVHALILKYGCINDIIVGSALIDMYCKCGSVERGREIFDAMPMKNAVIWNEMIHGYAQSGFGDEAVRLYDCMIREGRKPDDITFVAVLSACSHSGLVNEGIRIFESMQIEHKVEPLVSHYTCVIDTLGRAGRLHEAEKLIRRMPCKDDPVIWEVLLSSCRFYSDILVAKRAADELLSLNPRSSTPYVLLANVYSSMGRWEEVRAVRELMSDNNVGKDAGYSWTENKNMKGTLEADDSYIIPPQSQWG